MLHKLLYSYGIINKKRNGEDMSKQLAPIHYGLYKKVILFENIERLIVEKTSREEGHKILVERFGDYIELAPLENIIDHNNIHGWLQNVINVSEKRQAALVYALMNADTALLEKVKEAYYEIGLETGGFFTASNAMEVFTHLNTVLLDGMPCDGVNKIIEQDENSIQWQTNKCVHKENWESQGVDVSLYYKFKEAFAKGFVKGITGNYLYKFSNEYKVHEIKNNLSI